MIVRTTFLWAVIGAWAAMGGSAPAAAQIAPSGPPPSQLNPEQLNPARQAPTAEAAGRSVFTPPLAGACPLADSPIAFDLTDVAFDGLRSVPSEAIRPLVSKYIGRKVRAADLCALRDAVTVVLFRRGVLARVDLPPQTIEGGRLVLRVTQAFIANVKVEGDAGPARATVEAFVRRLQGKAFDLAAVQRELFLAADLPGVQIQSALRPAEAASEPGALDLVLTVHRKATTTSVVVQNFGADATGRFSGLVREDFNSFTPFGERTSLVLSSSLFDDRQQVVQVMEEARLGASGLTGRLSASYGATRPGGDLASLKLEGRSTVIALGAAYPIVRGLQRDLTLDVGLEVIDQSTDIYGLRYNRDKLRVAAARLDGRQAFGGGRLWPAGVLTGDVQLRQGLTALGASKSGASGLSRFGADPGAFVAREEAQFALDWSRWASTKIAASAQHTDKTLLSYEDFGVGNLTIGRGYDPSALSGDQGWAVSAESRIGPVVIPKTGYGPWVTSPVAASAFAFVDTGHVDAVAAQGLTRTVRSVGGGVSFVIAPRARVDVFYAHPIDRIVSTAPTKPGDRIMVSLVAVPF